MIIQQRQQEEQPSILFDPFIINSIQYIKRMTKRKRVNPQAGSISDCEIEAVYEANHWKLKQDAGYDDNDHSMHYPNREYVECN